MSYIGSTPTSQNFIAGTDYFNGTGAQVAFTLSRAVNTVNDIEVIVNNVEQIPSGYTVSGTTLTFSAAPSAGTSNVYVRYLSTTLQSVTFPTGSTQSINITGNAATATTATNQSGGTVSATSITDSGNLNFTGTGNRITGDFSNATHANRVAFQTSTVNGSTSPFIIPNGTGTLASLVVANSSDPSNCSYLQTLALSTETRINSGQLGTGTNLPMTFYTAGGERVRVDTSGNVGIGTSSPTAPLHVNSASNPQIKFGGSSAAYYWALDREDSAGDFAISNANGGAETERMRISASGNVGIGTSSPTSKLHVRNDADALTVIEQIQNRNAGASAGGVIAFINSASDLADNRYAYIGAVTSGAAQNGNNLVFATNPNGNSPAERMRIDSSGNLLVGTTNVNPASSGVAGNVLLPAGGLRLSSSSGASYIALTATSGTHVTFYTYNSGAVSAGTITSSGSSTAYNSTSDYRLKEAVAPMTGALAKVAALKPCTYKWKVDGSDGQGFIAHELAEVEPGCVTGEKDAVDADGNPQYQGIDTSFLVATLTAAIQEQQTLITALTARITALEAK